MEKRVRGECKVKVGVLEDKIARLESRLRLEEAREELGAPDGGARKAPARREAQLFPCTDIRYRKQCVVGGREWWRREEQEEGERLEVKEQKEEREEEPITFQYWRQPLVELSEEQLSHFMGGRSEKEQEVGEPEGARGRGDLLLPHFSPFLYWQQPVAALAGEQVRDILGGKEKVQEQEQKCLIIRQFLT